jgi:GT2 family glycosyltransferase
MDLAGAPVLSSVHQLAERQQRRTSRGQQACAPRLSIVIVNYRDWQGTADLAWQVLRSTPGRRRQIEVMVVDNHSPAEPIVPRLRRWAGMSLRRWGRNRGFARAANEGARLSSGDWLLFLNPDVTLPRDFFDGVLPLAAELEAQEPRTGVVGFRLENPDGSPQFSTGPWPTLAGTVAGLALPRHRRKCRPIGQADHTDVPWVTGCCMLVHQDCWRALGGFDPRFFLYYEDVDFCRRAQEAGWSVRYERRLWAVHHRPLHRRPVPPQLRVITRHALLSYAAKHWPTWQTKALGWIVRLEARFRRWWAGWHGDHAGGECFVDLERIAEDLGRGRERQAKRRLLRMVERTTR